MCTSPARVSRLQGNGLCSDISWDFTTEKAAPCRISVFRKGHDPRVILFTAVGAGSCGRFKALATRILDVREADIESYQLVMAGGTHPVLEDDADFQALKDGDRVLVVVEGDDDEDDDDDDDGDEGSDAAMDADGGAAVDSAAAGAAQGGEDVREEMDVPSGFYCYLTRKVMKDPVVAEDGRSYEREAILQYIQRRPNLSPATAEPMGPHLVPNVNLRTVIREFAAGNGITL